MSRNAPEAYGRDVRCMSDADALWTETSGLALVEQDTFHRITTNDILGDDGTGTFVKVGWGKDVREFLGMTTSQLAGEAPGLVEVVMRDERITSADVQLTATTTNGLADVFLELHCMTALGPFSIVGPISQLTAILGAQQ